MTGVDSTNICKGLRCSTWQLLNVPVCLCAPQGWVCSFRQGPFLRAECTRCMWRCSGRTTWGTQRRLPHHCPGAAPSAVSSTMSPVWETAVKSALNSARVCVFVCAPPGPQWTMAKQCWALWWAAGPPAPCWLGPSSSPCTTVPCVTASRIGWSSSRTIPIRTSGRWDVGGSNVHHRGRATCIVLKRCVRSLKQDACIWFIRSVILPAFGWLQNLLGKDQRGKILRKTKWWNGTGW